MRTSRAEAERRGGARHPSCAVVTAQKDQGRRLAHVPLAAQSCDQPKNPAQVLGQNREPGGGGGQYPALTASAAAWLSIRQRPKIPLSHRRE